MENILKDLFNSDFWTKNSTAVIGLIGVIGGWLIGVFQQMIVRYWSKEERIIQWKNENIVKPILDYITEELFLVDDLFFTYSDVRHLDKPDILTPKGFLEYIDTFKQKYNDHFEEHRKKYASIISIALTLDDKELINALEKMIGEHSIFRGCFFQEMNPEDAVDSRKIIIDTAKDIRIILSGYINY